MCLHVLQLKTHSYSHGLWPPKNQRVIMDREQVQDCRESVSALAQRADKHASSVSDEPSRRHHLTSFFHVEDSVKCILLVNFWHARLTSLVDLFRPLPAYFAPCAVATARTSPLSAASSVEHSNNRTSCRKPNAACLTPDLQPRTSQSTLQPVNISSWRADKS